MHRHFFSLLLVGFFLVGCVENSPKVEENNIVKLSQLLHTQSAYAISTETMQLSRDIFSKTAKLTKEFQMTSPPQYHNFLVNIGMKEKGLCYHWSDALYLHFMQSDYPSFEFHLAVSNKGEYWSEHNSLVIVGKGKPIESGIVIDPWRYAGKLYFSKLKDDKQYHWIHRPTRGCQKGK